MEFINCREISGGYYSSADTEIDCDGVYYNNVIFPFNILILSMFAVIIPTFIFVILNEGFKNQI